MPELVVRHHTVLLADLPPAMDGLTIAHLADLHFRRWTRLLERVQEVLAAARYDLLAITGDICHHRRQWRLAGQMMLRFLQPIRPAMGCFASLGNHDDARLAEVWADGPIRLLRDQAIPLARSQGGINLVGLDQRRRSGGNLDGVLRSCRQHWPTIVLAHFPSIIHRLRTRPANGQQGRAGPADAHPTRIGLVLCGHTHGGQWRFGKFGCLWANDRIARRYALGLHRFGSIYMHVTAGIGTSGPLLVRVNCPPEVAFLHLRRGEPD